MFVDEQKKKGLENYINERITGLSIPIDLMGEVLKRFKIHKIEIISKARGPSAYLQPCKGGFIIIARIPPRRDGFRFVIAHEIAHTFFYDYRGPEKFPIHYREPFEEDLCDFGSRVILIPRIVMPENNSEDYSLRSLLKLADKLIVKPQLLVTRLIEDFDAKDSGLLIYQLREGNYELKGKAFSSENCLKNRISLDIKKLIKRDIDENWVKYDRLYLGKPNEGKYFDIEIIKKRSLFSEEFYIFLKINNQ